MTDTVGRNTVRVLVVSAQDATRDEVNEALAGWGADIQLHWVSEPNLASGRAEDLLPQVILVDDALAGASAIALIRELTARVPGSVVLALVRTEDMSLARQAVLAGARGFLTKPIQADELETTLQQALLPRQAQPWDAGPAGAGAGKIVVFCAPKGGTGRTTLAINTAVGLRMANKRQVALVDADYAAPALDVALNLDSHRNVADLLPRLSRLDEDLVSGILAPHASGLRVLLAPPPADLSNPISLPQVQYILELLKRMFPWVVVDLGLPMDETAFAFLDSADRIVMTVLPEMVGLRNTRLMLDQLHARGHGEERVWLVLNRANMRGGVKRADIEERLHVKVTHRVPDDQPLATHSINRGVPLVMSHRRSAVSRAIRKLAKRMIEEMPSSERITEEAGAPGQ